MLARVTPFALLLAVTGFTTIGIAACPQVPSSLASHVDGNVAQGANVATLEPAPEEESGVVVATDNDGA